MVCIYVEDINITPLPHQIETAEKVINQLNGRAILADEVGMGKTIEAGLILKKYINSGLVKRFLILVPATLGFQWTSEMVEKFNLKKILYNRRGRGWEYFDYQIASLDKAKREEHARYLKKMKFDLLIVDEAHKLKNDKTMNWKFVNSLNKKFCLLLTATPLQNELRELYNLIKILYPDLYQSYNHFKDKYSAGDHNVQDSVNLQKDLDKIMIRNNHKQSSLPFPERHIKQILIDLKPREEKTYQMLNTYVKEQYRRNKKRKKSILELLTYQREICSSFAPLQRTLAKKEEVVPVLKEIFDLSTGIGISSKLKKTMEIIEDLKSQVLIFTEYRATQQYIAYFLEKKGFKTILFNGGLSPTGKEYIKYLFQNKKDVMISTEAGSQGLNLQFCNIIINYDLPWNPMKLEQRIGRIHRLGQTKDVFVYNLATKGTIEEKMLKILYRKIYLLKKVMGTMENILIDFEKGKSLESNILQIIGEAESDEELEEKLEILLEEELNDGTAVPGTGTNNAFLNKKFQ